VARHYEDLIDGFVLDETDADLFDEINALNMRALMAQTVMASLEDRDSLADYVIAAVDELAV